MTTRTWEFNPIVYVLSLGTECQGAYQLVMLFLAAVGYHFDRIGHGPGPWIQPKELHENFPAFAKKLGIVGKMYDLDASGKCWAVSIYLRDGEPQKKESFWAISPWEHYLKEGQLLEESLYKDEAVRAALDYCKIWLPDWRWD